MAKRLPDPKKYIKEKQAPLRFGASPNPEIRNCPINTGNCTNAFLSKIRLSARKKALAMQVLF